MDMLIEVVVVSICIHMNPNIGKCGVAAAATARSHFKWELSLLFFSFSVDNETLWQAVSQSGKPQMNRRS